MKRCSTCNRTYTDPNLSFCIDDGTPLTTVETEDESTVVRPRDTADEDWNAVAYRPPVPYVPPGTHDKPRRRVWPWVAGFAGAFLLGILALVALATITLVRRDRERQNQRIVVRQPDNSNTTGNSNSNNNSNTNETTTNTNSNSTEHDNTRPPTDRDQVIAQLKEIENEWTVANLNADKKKLDRILADDYAGQETEEGGGLVTKSEYINKIERDTQVEKWEFGDLNLTLAGDRATLSGIITYFVRDRSVSYDFKDRFVWREGRWQATGAELKRRGGVDSDL